MNSLRYYFYKFWIARNKAQITRLQNELKYEQESIKKNMLSMFRHDKNNKQ